MCVCVCECVCVCVSMLVKLQYSMCVPQIMHRAFLIKPTVVPYGNIHSHQHGSLTQEAESLLRLLLCTCIQVLSQPCAVLHDCIVLCMTNNFPFRTRFYSAICSILMYAHQNSTSLSYTQTHKAWLPVRNNTGESTCPYT